MAYLDRLPPMSFAEFKFPVKRVSIKGSLRHHVHEYPHSPGGALEGLGRRLYEVTAEVSAQETFPRWPKLIEAMASIRTFFEGGTIRELTIPHIGTIDARCIAIEEDVVARVRSGYDVRLTFLEDQDQAFLIDKLVTTSQELMPATETLRFLLAARDTTALLPGIDELARDAALQEEARLFDRLLSLASTIGTLAREGPAGQKAQEVLGLCSHIDARARTLNDPRMHAVLDAFHEVWASAREIAADARKRGRKTLQFAVPAPGLMPITQVSTLLYGTSAKALELMRLNDLDDALQIRAGTLVNYYPAAA